jgi:hypothetical protein
LVKTTFLELIGNLIDQTPDDAALMAAVKRIFDLSEVRLIRSLASVRLVNKGAALGAGRPTNFGKAKPAWT